MTVTAERAAAARRAARRLVPANGIAAVLAGTYALAGDVLVDGASRGVAAFAFVAAVVGFVFSVRAAAPAPLPATETTTTAEPVSEMEKPNER